MIIDIICLIAAALMLIGGILIIKDSIKKNNFGKSFCKAGGMIIFGCIIIYLFIKG